MGKTADDVNGYSMTVVTVFGIVGNILVIISILKQRCLLRSNYYVLVLQLAICDLAVLIMFFYQDAIVWYWANESFNSVVLCVHSNLLTVFKVAGIGMMLVISVLRYRATIHPLKPAISRRKLKVVCGLMYIVGFILACGIRLSSCFVRLNSYYMFSFLSIGIVWHVFPPIIMAVVYYKVGRALFKQTKRMKHLCHAADAVKKRHIRDRRTFLICLTTVLFYGIGNLPITARYIVLFAVENRSIQLSVWFSIVSAILETTCSNAINPVIYGILDKQLRTFWKSRKPNTRRPPEQFVQQVDETPL